MRTYVDAQMKKDGQWEVVSSTSYWEIDWPGDTLLNIGSNYRIRRSVCKYEECDIYGYANLKDLLNFEWDSKVTHAAYLFSEQDYRIYDMVGNPGELGLDKYHISDGISPDAQNLVILSEQQYFNLKKKNPRKVYAILVREESTYRELADDEWWKMVEELKSVGNPENIRITFFIRRPR